MRQVSCRLDRFLPLDLAAGAAAGRPALHFAKNLVGLEEGGRSPQGEDRRGTGRGPLWKSGSFWNHTCMILHGGFATYFCIGPRALSRLKSVKRQRLLPFPSFGLWKGQCLRACDVLAGRQESAVDR